MNPTLVLPESIGDQLRGISALPVESGGVLIARLMREESGRVRLLGRRFVPVPDEAYLRREADQLLVRSEGYVPALGLAETDKAVPIWLHTHPGEGSSPKPSRKDSIVDSQLAELFRIRSGSNHYGALIISQQDGTLRFTGHLESASSRMEIDRLLLVGSRLALSRTANAEHEALPAMFDRNIRAFGGDVQRILGNLRIAIVGCGGTGSSVAEQLVRLGVREFLLVDPDKLAETNLTRVYGSYPSEVGRRKVDVLADHLRSIAPTTACDIEASMITVEATARKLIGVDLVFGCTDDNAGRLVLSRAASYLLVPVIDCGVLLTGDGTGRIDGIHGRITLMYPGVACLVCRNRIDLDRARSEMLTPAERHRRVAEGYAPALGDIEPAVVSFTSLVASVAVSELLERLTRFGPEPAPSEILLRIHDREISTNEAWPRERHYCHPAAGKLGAGSSEPFLEQTWST